VYRNCFGWILLALAMFPVAAQAAMITPSADARAWRWWNAFGADYGVDSQSDTTLLAWYDPSDINYRYWRLPVMLFPTDALAGQTDITAHLSIHFENVTGGVQIRAAGDADGVIQPSTGWLDVGAVVTTIPEGTTGWVTVDVSGQVQTVVNQQFGWMAFTVRPADWWCGATIDASESSAFSPYVTWTPEPASLGLLALGGLALIRRRKA
jgi:hypothetical protein